MDTYAFQRPLTWRRSTIVLLVVAVALTLSACGGDEEPEAAQGEPVAVPDTPDWIEKIYPSPDSEASHTQSVQVVHTAIAADEQVRLLIDGTDVTSQALGSEPGLLVYDMDDVNGPVQLRPGDYTAEAQLFRRTPGSGEGTESFDPDVHEVIDSYSWEFTVL